ncbi:MAG: hypothetical protein IJ867_05595 [Clostridia bacterium]|nr:hypothetical protein [Clostridia bacterium]
MEKRETKKSIRNILLFVLLIFITFYIIFKDQNPNEIINVVRSADKKFVLIAVRIYGFIFLVRND